MKERCYNKNFKFYNRYGGRGIVVCDEWLKFKPFEEWCLKSGYSDNLTLDRKENSGNYTPDNCKWSTHKEQANNRVSNVFIEHYGEINTLARWCEISGIAATTLHKRYKNGLNNTEHFFSEPIHQPKLHSYNGRIQTLREWSKELGVEKKFLESRLLNGWSIERTLSTPKRSLNA